MSSFTYYSGFTCQSHSQVLKNQTECLVYNIHTVCTCTAAQVFLSNLKTYSATPNSCCQVMAVLVSKSQPISVLLPGERPPCRTEPRHPLRVEGRSGFKTRHMEGFRCKCQVTTMGLCVCEHRNKLSFPFFKHLGTR